MFHPCAASSNDAQISECDNAYVKYALVHGEDWTHLDGPEDGISQISRKTSGPDQLLVWNFPLEATYKATNAFGWPQIILSVYEIDHLGRDIIKVGSAVQGDPGAFKAPPGFKF